jgi:hypothetical protein
MPTSFRTLVHVGESAEALPVEADQAAYSAVSVVSIAVVPSPDLRENCVPSRTTVPVEVVAATE